MRPGARASFLPLLVVLAAHSAGHSGERLAPEPLWVDNDTEDIPEPGERRVSRYFGRMRPQLIERPKQALDLPRWVRAAVGAEKQAGNVNAVDEVPDSSWYTNRHHRRRMTLDELRRGPNRDTGPDFGAGSVVVRSSAGGVTPGLWIKDARGETYIVKFDNAHHPELQSGAEVISTKILHSAGYNVPENHIAYLRLERLEIGGDVTIGTGKRKRPFERRDLEERLAAAAVMSDGSYRVLASKHLAGKPKGPFAHVGIRLDDRNDRIPHEHRRELRGLRVLASWLNHWDLKEENGLDMYVEEGGRRFLRHYLIDFGSSLGGAHDPLEYYHGREYIVDGRSILKEILTLGRRVSPWERKAPLISPAVGTFSNEGFDPERWKPHFPLIAFSNMTDDDAFWATRIVLSVTEPELREIVGTARYSRDSDAEYLVQTLWERRNLIAEHWLSKLTPLDEFSTELSPDGGSLRFKDLLAEHGLDDSPAEYVYEVRGPRRDERGATREARIPISRAALESGSALLEVDIRAVRGGSSTNPVTVRLYHDPAQRTLRIVAISRG